ncbi:hypothetical protein COU56_04910 [Candidatus Pacearchaeota archaeon CG10_big_fil_rev_8_21_14_0_10_31_9]|nr:MAG: hypothetical protein COU56_04910 [Candidatus Pacearchaeota archaeon CG10_big_fil_rev_8_21_14_0_10_31_9]PIZ82473.1 MAG: hypothetical protein COX97_04610 [Candidatus Pacearchaeota archaeon CG_4_10_14_0_2_um_filter_05_32_18]
MGEKKHLDKVMELFQKSLVVDFDSIKRIVGENKKDKGYSKQLVRNLIKSGSVRQITKGYYTTHNNYQLSVFCFKPSYFGLQDTLSYYNVWEQETIPIIITTKKVRNGIRKVFGKNIMIKRIDKRYFFGFEFREDHGFYYPYSNIEKTLIDLVYFNIDLSDESLWAILNRVNEKKIKNYLTKYPKRFRVKFYKKLKLDDVDKFLMSQAGFISIRDVIKKVNKQKSHD